VWKLVAAKFANCALDLMGIQEDRWEEGGAELPDNNAFSLEKAVIIINYGQEFSYIRESYQ
jgi:hypothetical protein